MNAPPVDLRVCRAQCNYLTGTMSLSVGIRTSKGKTKTVRYNVTVTNGSAGPEHCNAPGCVTLAKSDGEVVEVKRTPGRNWFCSCDDAKYRQREGGQGCKHLLALVKAHLIDLDNQQQRTA